VTAPAASQKFSIALNKNHNSQKEAR